MNLFNLRRSAPAAVAEPKCAPVIVRTRLSCRLSA